ncbi:MAG: hypothetical protein ACXABM_14190 [Candidatus Thorarchaeota archaeon]|jgi:hypothetical protein
MTVVKATENHPLYKELVSIVGEKRVNDNPVIISAYSQDACHLEASSVQRQRHPSFQLEEGMGYVALVFPESQMS